MIFKVEQGYYGYPKQQSILNDINFIVNEGEVLAILGSNGIGKTTLLKCMMGLLPWKSGLSLIDGKAINHLSSKEIWKNIGYVPQAKAAALSYTAKEMILLGRSAHLNLWEQPKKKDMEIVDEVIEMIGIADLKNKSCNQMSGGELQMVLIARALATKPKMLVLDEPESNLDFKNQLIILEIIDKLSKIHKISCVINTHYPEHALRVSDKSLILCKNKQTMYGQTTKIINKENMQKAFDVDVVIEEIKIKDNSFTYVFPIKFNKEVI
ncbi:MAG: ABC transporter ATP-binding protein [Tissierellia bacterium]|nr:ABC transporter ATP-binding protein [Tissierellia bacterium]